MKQVTRTRYIRVCAECANSKEISYKPKPGALCRVCASRITCTDSIHKRWAPGRKKIRYTYFCPTCPVVVIVPCAKRTAYCTSCSRKHAKKKEDTIYFDLGEMMYKVPVRHYRVCRHCNDTKEVACKARAVIASCNKCKHLGVDKDKATAKRKKTLKANGTKLGSKKSGRNLKPRTTQYSQEAIDKVREENRRHKEAQQNKPKLITQTMTEDEMVAKWLEANEIAQVENTQMSDAYLGDVNIKGY